MVLHGVTVCCSMSQCVAVCCRVLQCVAVGCSVLQCVAVCCSVLQCVAVCCSVVQRGAVCCSVLQCVATTHCNLISIMSCVGCAMQHIATHCNTLLFCMSTRCHEKTQLQIWRLYWLLMRGRVGGGWCSVLKCRAGSRISLQ